jgi:16S rRNA (guanine527-N7)-methyltransferase
VPRPFDEALERALVDLGLTLPHPVRATIETHVRLLLAWNRRLNLTAITDPADLAIDHVADSLAALPLLRSAGLRAILDVGSGSGFPGLTIAAALPAERAVLVDSIAKKTRFLRVVVEAVGLAGIVDVVTERAEILARQPEHRERWSAVTARAVGSLAEVAEIGLPLVAVGGLLIAWKRQPIDVELPAARAIVRDLGGDLPEIATAGLSDRPRNVLVVIEKMRRTPDDYPRGPAVRRRRPGPDTRRVG